MYTQYTNDIHTQHIKDTHTQHTKGKILVLCIASASRCTYSPQGPSIFVTYIIVIDQLTEIEMGYRVF